jgi:hypothetical protein
MSTEKPTSPHVYQAVRDISKELAAMGISKDRRNTQGASFNFRGIDDVMDVLAPLLPKYNLVMLPRAVSRHQEERQSKSGGALFYTDVVMEYDLVSAIDGSKHTISMFGEAMDSSDKSTNKAESAAFKYACFQAYCIPVQGTPEADAETPEAAPSQKSQQKRSTSNPSTTGAAPAGKPGQITPATLKAIGELRRSEDGERLALELLGHWKLVVFDACTEKEGQEAVKWISSELKAMTKGAA